MEIDPKYLRGFVMGYSVGLVVGGFAVIIIKMVILK